MASPPGCSGHSTKNAYCRAAEVPLVHAQERRHLVPGRGGRGLARPQTSVRGLGGVPDDERREAWPRADRDVPAAHGDGALHQRAVVADLDDAPFPLGDGRAGGRDRVEHPASPGAAPWHAGDDEDGGVGKRCGTAAGEVNSSLTFSRSKGPVATYNGGGTGGGDGGAGGLLSGPAGFTGTSDFSELTGLGLPVPSGGTYRDCGLFFGRSSGSYTAQEGDGRSHDQHPAERSRPNE